MDVMDVGRMAVLADPSGAVFCLWQPKAHIGAELVNEHGSLTWNELITPDPDAVAPFYGDLFGWKAQYDDMGDFVYTTFMLGDRAISGAMKPPWTASRPTGVCTSRSTTPTRSSRPPRRAAQRWSPEPMDIPPGRMAVISDPQGAVFSVLALAQPAD